MLGLMQQKPLLISSLLTHAARHHAQAEVVSATGEGNTRHASWAGTEQRARRLARALQGLGVAPQDRVGTLGWNDHRHLEIYYATSGMGAICHTINPRLAPDDIAYIVNHAGDGVLCVDPGFAALIGGIGARIKDSVRDIVMMTDAAGMPALELPTGMHLHCYDELLDAADDDYVWPTFDENTASALCYTSGTTGRPKGVLHTHNSIHALISQIGDRWLVDGGDVFLVPSPIAHIGGSIYAFECPLLLGTTAVLMERWDPDAAVQLMLDERCTHMAGATPFLVGLLAAAERAATRLPDLKVFICGGASVPASLIRDAAAYFERAVVSRVYGSTEVPVTTVGALGDVEHAADTDGRAGIADIKLVDGEIRARGPQMLVGYLHTEDETGSFDDEGFFRTGDLGRWVDDEYLVVTGRAKDIIIRNGENISPKEIEDILIGHAGIAEIAVVGIPDERTGERACAVIVASDDSAPALTDLRELLMREGLAKFKVPEQVEIWDSLPKNDAGKVLKHQIRARLTRVDV